CSHHSLYLDRPIWCVAVTSAPYIFPQSDNLMSRGHIGSSHFTSIRQSDVVRSHRVVQFYLNRSIRCRAGKWEHSILPRSDNLISRGHIESFHLTSIGQSDVTRSHRIVPFYLDRSI